MHTRQGKVPHEIGLREGRDESTRGGVDVHWDVRPSPCRQRVEGGADLADRLVAAVERRAQDRHHADRVLVAVSHRL